MAMGVETLLKSLLNAMGFNPEEFIGGMSAFVNGTQTKLADFDRRLTALETAAVRVEEKIDLILAYQKGKVIAYVRNDGNGTETSERTGTDLGGR
jgi:hypothetical protein